MFKQVSSGAKNVRKFFLSKKMLRGESQTEVTNNFFEELGVKHTGLADIHDEVYVFASQRYVYILAKCYTLDDGSGTERKLLRINGYLFYQGHLFYEYIYYNQSDGYHNQGKDLIDNYEIIKRNYELQESVMTDELARVGSSGTSAKSFATNCNRLLRSDETHNIELYMEEL